MTTEQKSENAQRQFAAGCALAGFAGIFVVAGVGHLVLSFWNFRKELGRAKEPWE